VIFDAIKAYWDYQKSDRPAGHIGMSGIGHCARQMAYQHHQVEGSPLEWRSKVIFDDGDMHHDQLRKALREGLVLTKSCYGLYGEEEEVCLGVLKGHIDGMLAHETEKCDNSQHKDMLLEIKSMNERGFAELKRTKTLSFEYRAQVSAYLRASGLGHALILVKNKNTGDMFTLIYEGEDELLDNRLNVLSEVLRSEAPEDLRREYHPEKDGDLDWHCNYCPFVMMCWRHEGVIQKGSHYFTIGQKTLPFSEIVNKKCQPVTTETDPTQENKKKK